MTGPAARPLDALRQATGAATPAEPATATHVDGVPAALRRPPGVDRGGRRGAAGRGRARPGRRRPRRRHQARLGHAARAGCDLLVDTSAAGPRSLEHAAGDLVVVAQAGARLADAAASARRRAASGSRSTSPCPAPRVGGTLATNASGPAAAALRHRPRPADRHHRGPRRRRGRQGRRQGGQERRRLRPRQAAHRLVRHARRDHRGGRSGCTRCPPRPRTSRSRLPSTPAQAPRGWCRRSLHAPGRCRPRSRSTGPSRAARSRSPCCSRAPRPASPARAARRSRRCSAHGAAAPTTGRLAGARCRPGRPRRPGSRLTAALTGARPAAGRGSTGPPPRPAPAPRVRGIGRRRRAARRACRGADPAAVAGVRRRRCGPPRRPGGQRRRAGTRRPRCGPQSTCGDRCPALDLMRRVKDQFDPDAPARARPVRRRHLT